MVGTLTELYRFLPMPRLRMHEVIPPLSHIPLRHYVELHADTTLRLSLTYLHVPDVVLYFIHTVFVCLEIYRAFH
jgi:hypothetical protein